MNLTEIIDRAAANVGGNQALADRLRTGTATLANWRHRPGTGPNEKNQIALAKLSGVPLCIVAAATHAKTAKRRDMRRMWIKLIATLGQTRPSQRRHR